MGIKKLVNPNTDDFVVLIDNGNPLPNVLTKAHFDHLLSNEAPNNHEKLDYSLKRTEQRYRRQLKTYREKLKHQKQQIQTLKTQLQKQKQKSYPYFLKTTNAILACFFLITLLIISYLGLNLGSLTF
ncbi:hypothetical protein DID77_02635 [Candidatus Marinamargulisbacteria bacterium SCGC AG-439-L15]|nr:hypothetical protein DID77_02635 [Candidatus Marinamargulisbacteria bacterium SCGC AG-439-L15]